MWSLKPILIQPKTKESGSEQRFGFDSHLYQQVSGEFPTDTEDHLKSKSKLSESGSATSAKMHKTGPALHLVRRLKDGEFQVPQQSRSWPGPEPK
jgi:hypothetical protein